MSETKPKPERPKSRTNSELDVAISELIDKFNGRTRITTRDISGKRKILTVMFGPKNSPSHALEVESLGVPEDPLSREARTRHLRERRHEEHRLEIAREVSKALAKQKRDLETEAGIAPINLIVSPKSAVDRERWSKKDFTIALAAILCADDCPLGGLTIKQEGSNVIIVKKPSQEQTMKIVVSFPRQKKT